MRILDRFVREGFVWIEIENCSRLIIVVADKVRVQFGMLKRRAEMEPEAISRRRLRSATLRNLQPMRHYSSIHTSQTTQSEVAAGDVGALMI